MIPISLVTVAYAQTHTRVFANVDADDVFAKVWASTDACMDHIKYPNVEDIPSSWLFSSIPDGFEMNPSFIPVLPSSYNTVDSPPIPKYVIIPGHLQSAICLHAAELFENREASTSNPFSSTVLSLLESIRVPTAK